MENNTKIKTIIEFNQNFSCSAKSLAVKKQKKNKNICKGNHQVLQQQNAYVHKNLLDELRLRCAGDGLFFKQNNERNIREIFERENITVPRVDRQ